MNKTKAWENCKGFIREVASDTRQREWRNRAKKAYRFYVGDQWDKKDTAKLDSESKPHLTFNSILPTINLLSGVERQNRKQIKVYPKRGGTRKVAEVLTELSKHAKDVSNAEYEESMAFFDAITGGKGWLGLNLNYDYDPLNGDIVIERLSPFMMDEDPNATKYDLNADAKYIIRSYWWLKSEIVMNYPKSEAEVTGGGLENLEEGLTSGETQTVETEDYREAEEEMEHPDIPDAGKITKYKVRDIFWRSWSREDFLIHMPTLTAVRIHTKKATAIKELIRKGAGTFNEKQFKVIDRVVPTLHKTVTVGNIVLDHNDDPFSGITRFPFVRVCPYWVDGYIFGVVDNLIDPQQEENKRSSQALHLINQSANAGWLGEKGWYAGDKDELNKYGSKAGFNIEYHNGKKPEKQRPTPISTGHLMLSDIAEKRVERISGVNADLRGSMPERQESGIAMQLRHRQGMTVSEIVFDNFDHSTQIFNEGLVELIRNTNVFSPQEITSIIDEKNLDVDMAKIKSFKVGRYGIKVSKNPNLPTIRLTNFHALLEARKVGVMIPDEEILDLSDVPNKEAIIDKMKKMTQQQPPQGTVPPGG